MAIDVALRHRPYATAYLSLSPHNEHISIFSHLFEIYGTAKSHLRRQPMNDGLHSAAPMWDNKKCKDVFLSSLLLIYFIYIFPVVCCSFRILIHTRGDTAHQAEMDFLISPKCHLNLCICHLGIVYFADANDANNPRCGSGAAEIWKKRENDRPGRLPTTPGHLICIFGCSACCALCDCQKEPWKNTCQRTTIYVISDLN